MAVRDPRAARGRARPSDERGRQEATGQRLGAKRQATERSSDCGLDTAPTTQGAARRATPNLKPARKAATELDRLIHEPARLGIVSALAAAESLSFNDLKEALGLTDGNLAVHARKLETAGYVDCEKSFRGRKPHTSYRLTARGRQALERYVAHIEAIVAATRQDP